MSTSLTITYRPLAAAALITLMFSSCGLLDDSNETGATEFNVTYGGNGSTSGSAPVDAVNYLEAAQVSLAMQGDLLKTSHTFGGWNTQANGGGVHYAAGGIMAMPSADVTMFAEWVLIPTYNVTYNDNGSTSGTAPTDATDHLESAQVTLELQGDLLKTNFTFDGWNTEAGGGGTQYAAGATLTMPAADVDLFAEWSAVAVASVTTTPGDAQISVSWTAVTNATEYFVYYSGTDDFVGPPTPTLLNDSVGVISTTSATITALVNGNLQYVWVTGLVGGSEQLVIPGSTTATPVGGLFGVDVPNIQPGENALEVALDKQIVIPFTLGVDPATVNSTNVLVTDGGVAMQSTIAYDVGAQSITIDPFGAAWPAATEIQVEITTGVTSGGAGMAASYIFTITTLDNAALLGRWGFNNNGVDISGHGLDATVTGASYDGVSLHEGSHSLTLATGNVVGLGVVDLGNTFTYTAWVNVGNSNSIQTLFGNGTAGFSQDGIKVFVNTWGTTDGRILIESGNGASGVSIWTTAGFVTPGNWFHVAVTIDRPTGAAFLYFNGNEAVTTDSNSGLTSNLIRNDFNSNGSLFLNQFSDGNFDFNGKIDDVRFYSRVLTASEIRNIANEQ